MRKSLAARVRAILLWVGAIACGVLALAYAGSDATHRVHDATAEQVVLLHGLARSASSMSKLADTLQAAGYAVCNVEYPSRDHSIAILAAEYVAPAIKACFQPSDRPINFVTHSLGGILVRQLAESEAVKPIGRVVMLSPPNHGSEVVDKLGNVWGFQWLNGPAGMELGTGKESVPMRLGPATFELGVITGARSINPFLSTLIPGQDDGKVAVDHAKLDGMTDFLVLRCSHPFIMKSDHAIQQTLSFLKQGTFQHTDMPSTQAASKLSVEQPGDCWH